MIYGSKIGILSKDFRLVHLVCFFVSKCGSESRDSSPAGGNLDPGENFLKWRGIVGEWPVRRRCRERMLFVRVVTRV